MKLQSLFLISKFQSMATTCLPVCTANLQIPTVICYVNLFILSTSKTPSRSLDFLHLDGYVVMTSIFPTNQRKCANSSRSVAILTLTLFSTRLKPRFKKLIDSQHCKRHRKKRTREFHLRSLVITQPRSQKYHFRS